MYSQVEFIYIAIRLVSLSHIFLQYVIFMSCASLITRTYINQTQIPIEEDIPIQKNILTEFIKLDHILKDTAHSTFE